MFLPFHSAVAVLHHFFFETHHCAVDELVLKLDALVAVAVGLLIHGFADLEGEECDLVDGFV